jgi:sugar phosphate permease
MRLLRVTSVVLVMLCIMYFITYLDRVNVSTAAAGFAQDFHLNKTQIGLVFSALPIPTWCSRSSAAGSATASASGERSWSAACSGLPPHS